MLKDADPYDYAKAVRVFQKSDKLNITFLIYIASNPEKLAVEVVSASAARCLQTDEMVSQTIYYIKRFKVNNE